MNELSLTGEVTETHVIIVPPEAREALEQQGVPVPETVTLYLREATGGERRRWQQAQASASGDEAQRERILQLVMRRAAEGTDERVMRAVLDEATNSALAQLMLACITGYMPDPKAATAATGRQLRVASERAFETPSETSPSSATSTDSGPGSSTG